MHITDKSDGIFIIGHGVVSVSEMANGTQRLDPYALAPALAKINRYAGNTKVPWNDAEHSMLVAELTKHAHNYFDIAGLFLSRQPKHKTQLQPILNHFLSHSNDAHRLTLVAERWGLLHDVVECVVGDTPLPVKKSDERTIRRDGETTEDLIIAHLKRDWLGSHTRMLAQNVVAADSRPHSRSYLDKTQAAILDLLQDVVKPADKLALLIEMHNVHATEVLEYVYDQWKIRSDARHFVSRFEWSRLQSQAAFDLIDWRTSAAYWTEALRENANKLRKAFL